MPIRTANVLISEPPRYLTRLAKHFEHRVAVERNDRDATIRFRDGVCSLTATDEVLVLRLESESPAQLDQYEEVVTQHLRQVAPDQTLDVAWTEGHAG